jgi:hypothetical protein
LLLWSLLAACAPKGGDTSPLVPTPTDSEPTDSEPTDSEPTDSEPAYDCGPDQAALRAGVSSLDLGGSLPSALVVHGDLACPILVDDDGHSWVATGRLGAGRGVSLAHEGWLYGPSEDSGDADALLLNMVRWAGGDDAPTVIVEPTFSALVPWLADRGVTATPVGTAAITAEDLDGVDLVVTDAYTERSDAALDALHAWIDGGGGVIVGGHAWYYGPGYDDPATDYPGNRLLNDLGVTITVATAASGASTVSDPPPGILLHHARALDALVDHVGGVAVLSDDDVGLAATTALFAAANLPVSFDAWWDPARAFLDGVPPVVPTAAAPVVPETAPIDALAVALEGRLALESDVEDVRVVAAASDFPGPVSATAPRVTRTVSIDATWTGRDTDYIFSSAHADVWWSTGLYAAPGEPITVTVPASWAGSGLHVQIGSHADTLWHLASWPRHPEVVRRDTITAAETTVASGFGGLVYVTGPVGTSLGRGDVEVAGAVAAPWFVYGETDPAEFEAALASGGVPYAELQTDGVVLTVPTAGLSVADPGGVMTAWMDVMAAAQWLAGDPAPRARDERIVLDREISAGWMHSGYPVMGHLESTQEITDLSWMMTNSAWGPLHELGHNHQLDPAWLPDVTEATCNLWSVYLSERVLGVDRAAAHPNMTSAARAATVSDYLATGPDFASSWSVWTALETYLQLQERFGWAPIQEVHAQYLAMPVGDRPSSDQDRIDEWVIRTSLATKHDLTPFYAAWGWPMSGRVASEVVGLPPWTDHPLAP